MSSVKKKLRSSGGHKNPSYVVSIPLEWCQRLNLVKNSTIYLTLDDDRIILSRNPATVIEDKKEMDISLAQELESRFE